MSCLFGGGFADTDVPVPEAVQGFNAHLQQLSGTAENPIAYPVSFAAGLPAIASLYLTLISRGGADILMASTAYGGSSELTDICTRSENFRKHTYDITGRNNIQRSIEAALDKLRESATQPITVLFVEIPTNPG